MFSLSKLEDAAALIRQQHLTLSKKRVAYMKDLDKQLRNVERKVELEQWRLEHAEPINPKPVETKLKLEVIEESQAYKEGWTETEMDALCSKKYGSGWLYCVASQTCYDTNRTDC